MNYCQQHSGVCADMENVKKSIDSLWKGLNAMKGWVITGMGSTILAMALFILELVTKK